MIDIKSLPNLESFLIDYAVKYEEFVKLKIIEDNAYASNNLYNTFSVDVDFGADEGTYNITMNMIDYFKYVDKGRAPGKFPPPQAILNWIKIKPIVPRISNGIVPTDKQLAFLIGRSIKEKGIKARNWLDDVDAELAEEFSIGFKEALLKDVNYYMHESIKNFVKNRRK